MKTKWLAIILAGVAAMVTAGCGGGSGNSDVSLIKSQYGEFRKGLENKDIQRAMSVWSYDYLDNGTTYDDIKNGIANLFIDFNDIHVQQDFHDISVRGDFAYVTWTETLTATDAYTSEVKQSVTTYDDILHWEHGNWYLYGNQRQSVGVKKAPRYSGQKMREAPTRK